MQPLRDKLTLAVVRAKDGVVVRKTRGATGYFKFCYHGKCFTDGRGSFLPLQTSRLYYLMPDELNKPHWNRRRCHQCQRFLLAEGPPSD